MSATPNALPAERTYPPTEHVRFDPGYVTELPLESPAIAQVNDKKGDVHDIQAYITIPGKTPADNENLALSIKGDRVEWYRLDNTGSASLASTGRLDFDASRGTSGHYLKTGDASQSNWRMGSGVLAPTRDNEAGSLLLEIKALDDKARDRDALPKLEAAAYAPKVHPAESLSSFAQQANAEYGANVEADKRTRKWAKRMLGVMGIYAAIHSGGAIDRLNAAAEDPAETIAAVLDNPKGEASIGEDTNGYDWVQNPELVDKHNQAKDRIISAMRKWNDNDYKGLHKEAEHFKAEISNRFFPENQAEAIQKELDAATTNEQALAVLNKFASFYGKNVEFLDKAVDIDGAPAGPFDPKTGDLSSVKSFGTSLIKALKPLPKTLLSYAKYDTIALADANKASAYFANDQRIVYAMGMFQPGVETTFMDTIDSISGEPQTAEHIILHEMGHSLDVNAGMDSKVAPGEDEHNALIEVPKYILSSVVGVPTEQSFYAAQANKKESAAEAFADTFDVHGKHSLPGPHQWRAFNSPANKQVIANLGRYEQSLPGITSYIIDAKLTANSPTER